MTIATLIATLGVSILLFAFLLNIVGYIQRTHLSYLMMNVAGAGLSCYASVLIHFMPFVILEAVWALVAAAGIILKFLRD